MNTDDLIRRLAADAAPVDPRRIERALALAAGAALAVALCLVLWRWGVRADLAEAAQRPGVAVKFVAGAALAAAGLQLARRLARPAGGGVCLVSGGLMAIAALAAAATLATADGAASLGVALRDAPTCMAAILTVAAGPLAIALAALRAGATTRPAAAGAAAGLAAGALASVAYAVWCPVEDPRFVLVAYGAALSVCTAVGALIGPVTLRW